MLKFRKVAVVLKDERSGKTLKLTAKPFTLDGFEPCSGIFLDAKVESGGTRVEQSAVVPIDYRLQEEEDAEGTARVVIADFLESVASVITSSLRPPELDLSAEWRAFVQSRANRLYWDAQRKSFAVDVLENAARFGEYCALLRFVYLYFFVLFNSDAERLAAAVRDIAAALLNGDGRSYTFNVSGTGLLPALADQDEKSQLHSAL